MRIKKAETAVDVLEKYKKAETISPDWERVTIFSWNDMLLLKDEIVKLKELNKEYLKRTEHLWQMMNDPDGYNPDYPKKWFKENGTAIREAAKP